MAYRIVENSVNGVHDVTAYLCDEIDDLEDIPVTAGIGMGSYAEILNDSGEFSVYMLNSEGEWVKL